jgi:hypothetical protein
MSSSEYLPVHSTGFQHYVTINNINRVILPTAIIYKKGESDNDYTKLGTTRENIKIDDNFKENTFFIKNDPSQYDNKVSGGRKFKRSRKSYSSKKSALKSRRIRKSSRRYSRRR